MSEYRLAGLKFGVCEEMAELLKESTEPECNAHQTGGNVTSLN
jgi:hypothetical protein